MTPHSSSSPLEQTGYSRLEILILGLFFASGAGALVYEVVWSKLLTYTFGGSAFAIATVLAAYMAGLGLGSLWFGKRIDRRGHPLVLYGILEGTIGVWALILPTLLGSLDTVYGLIYRSTGLDFYAFSLIRFAFCFLLLLVPTTMMGGTLPVLGKLLLRNRQGLGVRAGLLYGINTLGAVVGVLSAGFILIPRVGLDGTTTVAILVNFLVVGAALLLAGQYPYAASREAQPHRTVRFSVPADPLKRAVLFVYAASGFAALSYEVAWTKALAMILGTTTYAFASMLTTFLLGLALGAFIFGKLADRFRHPEALLVWVQIAIPIFALLSIPVMEAVPQIWVDSFPRLHDSWLKLEAFRFCLAASTMFLPALLMGGTFPLATRAYVDRKFLGSSLGTLYAANTFGAILGSFFTGFVFIRLIGRQDSLLAASLVNTLAAGLLAWTLRKRPTPSAFRLVTALLVVALIPITVRAVRPWNKKIMTAGAFYYSDILGTAPTILDQLAESTLLFYKESTEASISVWHTGHIISLRLNGKVDASTGTDMRTQKLLAHLPLLYHHGTGQEAMALGLASGSTAGSMLTYPIKSLDVVEIVEGLDQATAYFSEFNHNCLQDPRFHLIYNDGRNQLKLSDKSYDIIISHATNPWVAGVGSLFTETYFSIAKSRLKPGGIICVWLQIYGMQEAESKAVLATFNDAFPHVDLWMGARGDLILLGSQDPLEWNWDYYSHALEGAPGEDLRSIEVESPESLFSFFVTRKEGLQTYLGDFPQRVTDNNLLLEYSLPRHMFQRENETNAYALTPYMTPPADLVQGASREILSAVDLYQRAHTDALGAFFNELPPGGTIESVYQDVLERAPQELLAREELSKIMNERALTSLQQGDLPTASDLFTRVVGFGTNDEAALALNNLGYIAYEAGKLDSAASVWNRAVAIQPNLASALYNLGLLAGRRNDHAAAAALYQKTITLNPRNPAAYNNAAYHMTLAGQDPDQALDFAKKAVSLERTPQSLDTLGLVLIRKQAFRNAKSVLTEAITADNNYHEGWFHLAQAQIGAGEPSDARRSLEEVISKSTDTDLVRQAKTLLKSL